MLKLGDFFVLCVLPNDVTDYHLVPVFQIVTDVLHSFILFQANVFILHATFMFNQAELCNLLVSACIELLLTCA